MKLASKDYIINTVFRTNILPIISECNTSCLFCSHKQNPQEIEVFRVPKLNLGDFDEFLNFLSPNKKIVIGEAATRIIEGEPLLHKDFYDILCMIRSRFKSTTIQVTTNGILLTEELVDRLVKLGNIELNISVNCVNPKKRNQILGISDSKNIAEIIRLLKGKIRYTGSMVFVPGVLDNNDIEDVVALLDCCEADAVRIFLQGYTDMAESVQDIHMIFKEVDSFIQELRQKYSIPVVIEPYFIKDLSCRVEGVIKGTPAWVAGMRPGDIIDEINGEQVKSRVDAFNRVFSLNGPVLKIRRTYECMEVKLKKPRNSSPGFVVLYDIDPDIMQQITRAVERNFYHNGKLKGNDGVARVWLMTSCLAEKIISELVNSGDLASTYKVISVKNRYFGGTIMCAGLLTVQDIIQTAKDRLVFDEKPDLIIVPPSMFDFTRRDLLGRSLGDIEKELGIPVDTI